MVGSLDLDYVIFTRPQYVAVDLNFNPCYTCRETESSHTKYAYNWHRNHIRSAVHKHYPPTPRLIAPVKGSNLGKTGV